MKAFPAHPSLQGAFAPWPNEGEIQDLIVEVGIPADLCGTFFRNGPNPQYILDEH